MEKRITKRDYFEILKGVVADNAELVEFLDAQIALLDKKKGSVNSKKVAEVEAMTEAVLNTVVEAGKAVTATEVATAMDISNQKASAYLKKLVEAGKVTRTEDKKKAYFTVA